MKIIFNRIVSHLRKLFRILRVVLGPVTTCNHIGVSDIPVISLTTYPARLGIVHLAIKSILIQSLPPAEVHLWIGSDCNDVKLPNSLTKLEHKGLKIHRINGNLKGHKKYLYMNSINNNNPVITIDDDCIYPKDTVEVLWKSYLKWPNCVSATRTRQIRCDDKILPYNRWVACFKEFNPIPRCSLVAIGVGGVLYPKGCLPSKAFDAFRIIQTEAVETDDLWLKVMETLNGIKVVWVKCSIDHPYVIASSQVSALNTKNVFQNNNDVVFNQLLKTYSLSKENFIDTPLSNSIK